jgi:hypothetical protein
MYPPEVDSLKSKIAELVEEVRVCKERYVALAAIGVAEHKDLEVKTMELKAENMMLVSRPPLAPPSQCYRIYNNSSISP